MALFNTPETRTLIRILAVIGLVILLLIAGAFIFLKLRSPHLLRFSGGLTELTVEVTLEELKDARFIQGMNGCENIVFEKDGAGFYVSCLDGHIHHLTPGEGSYRISQSHKAGSQVTGLALDASGKLLAAVNRNAPEDWMTLGASIERFSPDFSTSDQVTGMFPAMNGLAADEAGNVYFASSNFNIFNPRGSIYQMRPADSTAFYPPVVFIPEAGLANGLYYDPRNHDLYFSNTVEGAFRASLPDARPDEVYLKLRFMEACDDLCTDISGNVWMTDPGYSTVKMYNPGTQRLVRFVIKGIGQTSSVRIRSENGEEMLYITELKQKQSVRSQVFDGRGVIIIPARSLIELLEPLLIQPKNI